MLLISGSEMPSKRGKTIASV